MNQNTKVIVRVEYECKGKIKVCLGEADETNVENFEAGEVDSILMENEGKPYWVYKEFLISLKLLCVKSTVFEKTRVKDYANNKANTKICS